MATQEKEKVVRRRGGGSSCDVMVVLVWILILGSLGICFAVAVLPDIANHSLLSYLSYAIFIFTSIMTIVCYWRSIYRDPSAVPSSYLPPILQRCSSEEITARLDEYRAKASEKKKRKYQAMEEEPFRYCEHCSAFKPERSHHCRECNRCVLMLDHHCPWINNDVGIGNHKDFIQFLFYATFAMAHACILLIGRVVYWIQTARILGPPRPLEIILVVIDFIFLLPVCLAVGGLLWYQISNIGANLTTIDEYIWERKKRAARRLKQRYEWPYDLGWKANMRQFFGDTWAQWMLPGEPPKWRNGLTHKRRQQAEK